MCVSLSFQNALDIISTLRSPRESQLELNRIELNLYMYGINSIPKRKEKETKTN